MGSIPVQSFSVGSAKPRPDAPCIEEAAGYEGEWVTVINRSALRDSRSSRQTGTLCIRDRDASG